MYRYEYDVNGNITQIKDGTGVVQYQYHYDGLGQLIREDNRAMNATYTWSYDDAGNIQYKATYAFTTGTLGSSSSTTYYGYEYDTGWDDRLILYNGMPITYDEIGNPYHMITEQHLVSSSHWEEYGYEYVWNGRQLTGRRFYNDYCGDIWYDDYYDILFEYNADGIRTSKTAYGVEYKYILDGTQIIGESWQDYYNNHLILYVYDETGAPIGIKYRTEDHSEGVFDYFFFEKNLQGDIVAIYNANGRKIGSYIYDAWGNFRITTVSGNTTLENKIVNSYNPFRYRGYYYDTHLGLYYLQSRYYNSQWGRFINADDSSVITATPMSLTDKNLYAYCDNNPIMRTDEDGEFWHILIGAGVGAVAAIAGQFVSDAVTSVLSGEMYCSNWETYVGAALGGAAGGAVFAASGSSALADIASSAVTTSTTMILENVFGDAQHSVEDIVYATADAVIMDQVINLIPTIKVNNVNRGRNNYQAVYERGLTRMRNNNASKMCGKVMCKGIWSNIVNGASGSIANGTINHWNEVKHHFGFT